MLLGGVTNVFSVFATKFFGRYQFMLDCTADLKVSYYLFTC